MDNKNNFTAELQAIVVTIFATLLFVIVSNMIVSLLGGSFVLYFSISVKLY